jgi:hypothetical protein
MATVYDTLQFKVRKCVESKKMYCLSLGILWCRGKVDTHVRGFRFQNSWIQYWLLHSFVVPHKVKKKLCICYTAHIKL